MTKDVIELKKKLLDREFAHLNPMQREAVYETERPLLILAGAGSGKTTVIVNKIAYIIRYGDALGKAEISEKDFDFLLRCLEDEELTKSDRYLKIMQNQPYAEKNVLAITFTNKAAGEMKERLENKFGISTDSLWAKTFHSTCVRLLRRFYFEAGYDSNFTIYDDTDSLKLITVVLADLGINKEEYAPRLCKDIIGRAKTDYVSPEQFYETFDSFEYPKMPKIYERYQEELKKADAMDFDDLIFNTVKLLEENEMVRNLVKNKFRYVLVDEYQDTNRLQSRLIKLLCGDKICVVGDDDQSIYSFMGAKVENILGFEKAFPGARTIRLEQNYRSTQTILTAANKVIANNRYRKGKNLWTSEGDGEKITRVTLPYYIDEAEYIARKIGELHYRKNLPYNSFCVLYRTHSQSNIFETVMRSNAIPYRVFGSLSFFKRKEIQDIMAYLSLCVHKKDRTRLLRIINEPKRGIGMTTVSRIGEIAQKENINFFDVIERADEFNGLGRASAKLKEFAALINSLEKKAEELPPAELLKAVLDDTGYNEAISKLDKHERESRKDNIQELFNTIVNFQNNAGEKGTLQNFLEEQALVSSVDDLDEQDDTVTLMTIHASKGLEFNTVFVAGVEEGIFPSNQSASEEGGIEEERRLCYVALTRAKKKLFVSASQSRMLYGKTVYSLPSRFLKEIPEELVMHVDKNDRPVTETKPRNPFAFDFDDEDSIDLWTAPRKESPKKSEFLSQTNKVAAERPKQAKTTYTVGMKVRHKVFGDGVVTEVLNMSSDSMLTVDFPKVGSKKLMANYARLEIL